VPSHCRLGIRSHIAGSLISTTSSKSIVTTAIAVRIRFERFQRASAQSLSESYWSIGRRISKERLNTRAAYHNAILTDLSRDLDIGIRTLQRTVTFYEQFAFDDTLSVKRLTAAIHDGHYETARKQRKGKPLTLPRPTDPSYLYKAEVRDVIDADTLLLDIDLGLEVIRRQSIRLARTLVVNTRKYDIHRRYVAHVFYAFNNRAIERAKPPPPLQHGYRCPEACTLRPRTAPIANAGTTFHARKCDNRSGPSVCFKISYCSDQPMKKRLM